MLRTVRKDAAVLLRPLWGYAEPHVHQAEAWVDQRLGSYAPWQIAAGSIMATLVLLWVWHFITAFWADVREKGGRVALPSPNTALAPVRCNAVHAACRH